MMQTEQLEQIMYVKLAHQGIHGTIQTQLVKLFLVMIQTEELEQMEYVKLVQQGIN